MKADVAPQASRTVRQIRIVLKMAAAVWAVICPCVALFLAYVLFEGYGASVGEALLLGVAVLGLCVPPSVVLPLVARKRISADGEKGLGLVLVYVAMAIFIAPFGPIVSAILVLLFWKLRRESSS